MRISTFFLSHSAGHHCDAILLPRTMTDQYNFVHDPSGDVLLTLSTPNAPFAVWSESGTNAPDSNSEQEPEDGSATKPAPDVTFLLSSRHLALASPVLRAMLSGIWMEGSKKGSEGLYHLNGEDWDSDVFGMVMNMIHGQWGLVPTAVSLEMLAKLAVVVNYYDIRQSQHLILPIWMTQFDVSMIPTSFCREVIL
jgi:hypothetical protein